MGIRKYANDYRLENISVGKGKLKTVPVYAGKYFRFTAPEAVVRRMRVLYPVCWGVGALAWLAVMWMDLHETKLSWCVLLPMAAAALCLFFEGGGIYRLLTAKEQVTREHHDKLYDRVAGASLCHLISGGLAVAGSIAVLCSNPFQWKYPAVLLLSAVYLGCGVPMFLRRKNLRMEEIAPEPEQTCDGQEEDRLPAPEQDDTQPE